MMIRGDQHVDDWADVAVDYLDGRLDPDTRLAVEAHLAACPDCTARLRQQQSVVRILQETPLYDPPEDLEYLSIGELVFPSPGGQPMAPPVEAEKPSRAPRWYRTIRAWIPATVAVVALLAAVVGYGIARSGSETESTALNADRTSAGATTMAASATTAGPATTAAGAPSETMTTAGATTTTALTAGPPATEPAVPFAATQDRKAMINALATAQVPAFVSFRSPVGAAPADDATTTTVATSGTDTTAVAGTDTTADGGSGGATPGATDTTAAPSATDTTATPPAGGTTVGTVSATQADDIVREIVGFTTLRPLDQSLWVDGPTFAAFLPRKDAEKLVDVVRSIGTSMGLVVRLESSPPAATKTSTDSLLSHKQSFPVLLAHRALQPSTWGYDFTTSTLQSAEGQQPDTTSTTPDETGDYVIVIIWIAE
jgi:Putative zinc-finger